jgi:hypothetical protein
LGRAKKPGLVPGCRAAGCMLIYSAGKMMMHLFKVEVAIMMLQGICLKVEFVEFVIQILKKAAKLARCASEPVAGDIYLNCKSPAICNHPKIVRS